MRLLYVALDQRVPGTLGGSVHVRAVAEGLGRTPPASRYSPDMTKHAFLGTHDRIPQEYKDYAERL